MGLTEGCVCAEVLPKRMSGQTDMPLSEVSGRIQKQDAFIQNGVITTIYWQMRITE